MAWRRISLALVLASRALAGCSKKPGAEEQVMCVAREGDFANTLRGTDSIVSGAHERAGTYRVELSAPGYLDWSRDGVKVDRDACHVQTAQLRALLVRR